jgi:thiosulfate dehydrogenase
MPLVGVSAVYPEYNKREGRIFTLEDRIVGCFDRSQNATGKGALRGAGSPDQALKDQRPGPETNEVVALAAYITWLSEGFAPGDTLPWRGHNIIPPDLIIPVAQLSRTRGKSLFLEKCAACHGNDGQGVQIGDKKAGPLWGPASWNDGAGAARVYTLAGMIRYSMPYLNPGSLTDEEAQHLAAFINSMPRPAYPHKEKDYRVERLPPDAVYYKPRR